MVYRLVPVPLSVTSNDP